MDNTLEIRIEGELNTESVLDLRKRLGQKLMACSSSHGYLDNIAVTFDIRSYDYSSALCVFNFFRDYMRAAKHLRMKCYIYLDGLTREYLTKVKQDHHLKEKGIKPIAEQVLLYDENSSELAPMPQVHEVISPMSTDEATFNYIRERLKEKDAALK